jgi:hypothetical protein
MAFALKKRKFYLSPFTVQKLGGSRAADVMRLMVDEKLGQPEIMEKLGLNSADYDSITLTGVFKKELATQLKLREHDEKFRQANRALKGAKVGATPKGPPADVPPKELPAIQLARGQTPTEWVLKRINEVTPQAVERLVWLMLNGRQEQVQYNAAVKLLGLNGITEVEKSIHVVADAEAIIRELNKRGPYKPSSPEALIDTIDIPASIDGATIVEAERQDSVGDSTPDPEPPTSSPS